MAVVSWSQFRIGIHLAIESTTKIFL